MEFKFEQCLIQFPDNIKYTIYDEGYCYGIRFFIDNKVYELIHNRQVNWSRIYVRNIDDNYIVQDIPFKESTWKDSPWRVLPSVLNIEEI